MERVFFFFFFVLSLLNCHRFFQQKKTFAVRIVRSGFPVFCCC